MRRQGIIACVCLVLACAITPAAAQARKRHDPVLATLSAIAKRGGDQATQAAQWRGLYRQGKSASRHLRGAPQENVRGVLDNLSSLAKRHLLAGRAAPAFLILQRNLEWFWEDRRGAVAYGTRTTFPGSQLIYEFYPGSGWQLQPLANFGRLNGLLGRKRFARSQIESYANEMLATAVRRHGFLAFEYYFPWSGGPPGWVSGMATATGMQALSTLWKRDGDDRYLEAARAMARVFDLRPPWGVRIERPQGVFFLQYSQARSLLIGNAYAQAILGLDTYATNTGDTSAAALVSDAVAAARRIMPLYDTGAWSLYYRTPSGPGNESDLSYHELFRSFLDEMCQRWQEPFCGLASNFARYETEPVKLTALRGRVVKKRLRVSFRISKRSGVTLKLVRGTKTVSSFIAPLMRGRHTINWPLPRKGDYQLVLSAKSLNGITSEISREFLVPSS